MTEFNKVFLETNPIIYLLDDDINFGQKTEQIISSFIRDEKFIVSSVITATEYLVYPYKTGNSAKIKAFWDFIYNSYILLYPINNDIATEAAKILAEYKHFKPMDALQLASAICSGCDLFLTNDKQLRQFDKISCVTVEEWSGLNV